jgi:GT2 family glycosyltransferase
MTDPHLYVVIPVHDRLALTRACLSALERQTIDEFTVVIIDDGSSDGTADVVKREFPRAVLLHGDGSLWWAGAMNAGIAWVLNHAGTEDLVLTLNNDTIPSEGYLEGLLSAHDAAPRALIGSTLVSAHDRCTIIDAGVRVNWLTAKYHVAGRGAAYRDRAGEGRQLAAVDVLSGCGTLVPLQAYRNAGPYDQERLRHYAADFEFSRRALRRGHSLFVDWSSPLFVDETQTGIHASVVRNGLKTLLRSFWDIRSANDFGTRLRFATSACPRWALPAYVPMDYARVIVGSVHRLSSGGNA